jgi:hypothetical protein
VIFVHLRRIILQCVLQRKGLLIRPAQQQPRRRGWDILSTFKSIFLPNFGVGRSNCDGLLWAIHESQREIHGLGDVRATEVLTDGVVVGGPGGRPEIVRSLSRSGEASRRSPPYKPHIHPRRRSPRRPSFRSLRKSIAGSVQKLPYRRENLQRFKKKLDPDHEQDLDSVQSGIAVIQRSRPAWRHA